MRDVLNVEIARFKHLLRKAQLSVMSGNPPDQCGVYDDIIFDLRCTSAYPLPLDPRCNVSAHDWRSFCTMRHFLDELLKPGPVPDSVHAEVSSIRFAGKCLFTRSDMAGMINPIRRTRTDPDADDDSDYTVGDNSDAWSA